MNRVMRKGFYPPALIPKPMPNRWPQNLDFYYAPATTHILINQLKNSNFQEDDMTAISNAKTRTSSTQFDTAGISENVSVLETARLRLRERFQSKFVVSTNSHPRNENL